MAVVQKEEFDELKRAVDDLKARMVRIERLLVNVKDSPAIHGYVSKVLTLNASLNAVEILGRLANLEEADANLQTQIDEIS